MSQPGLPGHQSGGPVPDPGPGPGPQHPSLSLIIPETRPRSDSGASTFSSSDNEMSGIESSRSLSGYMDLKPLPSPLLDQGESPPSRAIFHAYNGRIPPSDSAISRQPSLRVPRSLKDPTRIFSEYVPAVTKYDVGTPAVVIRPPPVSARQPDGGDIFIQKTRVSTANANANVAPSSKTRSVSEKKSLPTESEVELHRERAQVSRHVTPLETIHSPVDSIEHSASDLKTFETYDPSGIKTTWREVRTLGRGAFSRVILACPASNYVRPDLRSQVDNYVTAIKIITLGPAGGASRSQIETGLKREIDILKSTQHPCLITHLGFNMDLNRALLVLPFYEGGDLFDFIGRSGYRPFEDPSDTVFPRLIQRIFAEVVQAVVYLHSNNIVHRDIKLENVLLKFKADDLLGLTSPETHKGPLCALTDLGLARRIDPDDPFLTTRCGSDDYVPPELMMGQPYDGRQTDSWALGVLLYAMMEQRLPFDPPPHARGGRTRGRTSHRIARVEWSWFRYKELAEAPDESNPWTQAINIVNGCLQRRDKRWLVSKEIVQNPWVSSAIIVPGSLEDTSSFSLRDIFINEESH